MSVQEWLDLLDDAELMLRPADYKIAVLAFVYAQQLEVEETERRAHMRLSFVEFLEAVRGGIALHHMFGSRVGLPQLWALWCGCVTCTDGPPS